MKPSRAHSRETLAVLLFALVAVPRDPQLSLCSSGRRATPCATKVDPRPGVEADAVHQHAPVGPFRCGLPALAWDRASGQQSNERAALWSEAVIVMAQGRSFIWR
jgi:hypothetical protein